MIEAPKAKLESGLLFKSFFTSVISNIFGVTRCYKSDCLTFILAVFKYQVL